ncbi:anti-repressor SinI family protein [Domibacillus sp. A3M-37]|nr:anti-repressor SinI family protein [Domibacillus tundrae]MCP3764198.1 anti-repressor SinI family protein [Domibacillus sp. A3M-37]
MEECLDAEWVELMKVARSLGLSIEEIKEFLAANKLSNPA